MAKAAVATATKKKVRPATVVEEVEEVEVAAPAPVKKKAKKKAKEGFTTAQASEMINAAIPGKDMTATALRRILRSDDGGHADGEYTRYLLSQAEVDALISLIKAGGGEQKKRGRKPKAEADVVEAPEELDALESDEDEEPEELEAVDEEEEEEADEDEDLLEEDEEEEEED